MPSEITEPHARASVISAHFWDNAQFPANAPDSVSPALEQALANFLSVAFLADETDSVRSGIRILLEKGGADRTMSLAEHYLYDPNSPMRSEETFLLFLNEAPDWYRTPMLLPEVLKNRVGSPGADFPYVDAAGKRGSLKEYVATHGETLVYFFDSECEVCKALIPTAAEVAADRPVLAVCPEANAGKFNEVIKLFPKDWTVVRDLGLIDSNDLYIFPALPSVYIFGPDMTVLAKDLQL